jgi:hypothetical protein|eukprot:COSAG02_NODE_9329_length_2254_cov_1.161021_2_plen_85_part_00
MESTGALAYGLMVERNAVIERNEIGFSLDESCPLMRNLDMLKPFESIKKMKRRGEWQCTGCNKLFRGEDFVSSGEMDCCNTPEA